jgi:hypothetical protein
MILADNFYDSDAQRIDIRDAVIAQLLGMLVTQAVKLDTFQTDNGSRAEISREGSEYDVHVKERHPMGS